MPDDAPNKRAPFIVIEGLDRSGKSTQAAILLARLEASGIPAKLIKFPGEYKQPHPLTPTLCNLTIYSYRLFIPHIPTFTSGIPDRTTPIGQMIDAYLQSKSELDDHVIHLLFAANRWELA